MNYANERRTFMMNYAKAILLDTETTDTENAEVIELAYLPLDVPGAGGYLQRFKPARPIKWGALAIHHILEEDLKDCPPAVDAPKHVVGAEYWIGHNIDFDWEMLGRPKVKRICTLAMARHLWPELDSHKLTALMYYLKGATNETRERVLRAHSAKDDVEMNLDILEVIVKVARVTTMQQLYEFSEDARVPRIMTFGKHKGKRVEEVDRGYSNWYRRQENPDPYLLEAFRRAGI